MLNVTGQTQKHMSDSTHPRDPEQQVHRGGRLNRDSQGWGGRNWEPLFHGYWLVFRTTRKFWKWRLVVAQHCERTSRPWMEHLTLVPVVNLVHILP